MKTFLGIYIFFFSFEEVQEKVIPRNFTLLWREQNFKHNLKQTIASDSKICTKSTDSNFFCLNFKYSVIFDDRSIHFEIWGGFVYSLYQIMPTHIASFKHWCAKLIKLIYQGLNRHTPCLVSVTSLPDGLYVFETNHLRRLTTVADPEQSISIRIGGGL